MNDEIYSVYVSDSTVELHSHLDGEQHARPLDLDINNNPSSAHKRLVCSQSDYQSIFRFSVNLAKSKNISFQNFVPAESQT